MQEQENIVVGLDIGTTKICAVVGEVSKNDINIIGIGTHPSIGLRKGVVVNIDGIPQELTRNPAVGPPDLMACHDVLEEVLLEMKTEGFEPLGRAGVLDALRALPAFQELDGRAS